MSLHEIEDAVEDAIRLLHSRDGLDHAHLFAGLLAFQDSFRAGDARPRVHDILEARGALEPREGPVPTPLDLGLIITRLAVETDAHDLIKAWFGLLEGEIHAGVETMIGPDGLDGVQAIPGVIEMRQLALDAGALDDLDFDGELPPREVVAANEVLSWWYGLE